MDLVWLLSNEWLASLYPLIWNFNCKLYFLFFFVTHRSEDIFQSVAFEQVSLVSRFWQTAMPLHSPPHSASTQWRAFVTLIRHQSVSQRHGNLPPLLVSPTRACGRKWNARGWTPCHGNLSQVTESEFIQFRPSIIRHKETRARLTLHFVLLILGTWYLRVFKCDWKCTRTHISRSVLDVWIKLHIQCLFYVHLSFGVLMYSMCVYYSGIYFTIPNPEEERKKRGEMLNAWSLRHQVWKWLQTAIQWWSAPFFPPKHKLFQTQPYFCCCYKSDSYLTYWTKLGECIRV